MKNLWIAAILAAACSASLAKIPAPVLDDAAKAKAAEAAAKTAWQGKIDAFLLCRAQDRVAAYYRKSAGSAPAKSMPVSMTTGGAAPPAAAAAAAPTAAAGNVAANPAVAGGTAAAPAGPPTPTPCADPGPFAFNKPSETPLEASGAHSPAGTAVSPPSVRAPAAAMEPAKK